MTVTKQPDQQISQMAGDDYIVHQLPTVEIYSDDEFNCRGKIAPIDVVELAQSVQQLGLQQPIMVQPYNNAEHPDKKYRIIAGHRRYMAFRINKITTIPAMIKTGLSDLQARLFNLTENLKRQDLNILQEARALVPFKKSGWQQEYIADQVKMSRGWVQVRLMLLDLPDEIQAEAAVGLLTQEQIRQLYGMPSNDERFAAVKLIKERRERGEKAPLKTARTNMKPFEKKVRNETEMFALQEYIQDHGGNDITTRLLGWAAGLVSNVEIYRDLQTHFREKGKTFPIPPDILKEL